VLPFRSFPTFFFVTDGHKHDYLSRISQRARGATKNKEYTVNLFQAFIKRANSRCTQVFHFVVKTMELSNKHLMTLLQQPQEQQHVL